MVQTCPNSYCKNLKRTPKPKLSRFKPWQVWENLNKVVKWRRFSGKIAGNESFVGDFLHNCGLCAGIGSLWLQECCGNVSLNCHIWQMSQNGFQTSWKPSKPVRKCQKRVRIVRSFSTFCTSFQGFSQIPPCLKAISGNPQMLETVIFTELEVPAIQAYSWQSFQDLGISSKRGHFWSGFNRTYRTEWPK